MQAKEQRQSLWTTEQKKQATPVTSSKWERAVDTTFELLSEANNSRAVGLINGVGDSIASTGIGLYNLVTHPKPVLQLIGDAGELAFGSDQRSMQQASARMDARMQGIKQGISQFSSELSSTDGYTKGMRMVS